MTLVDIDYGKYEMCNVDGVVSCQMIIACTMMINSVGTRAEATVDEQNNTCSPILSVNSIAWVVGQLNACSQKLAKMHG